MTAKVVKDRAASVRERLLNLARRRGEDFQITLLNYLFERFLYRLSLSDVKERFVVVSFDENSIVVEPIRADEEYAGVRATFEARLGAIRERLQVDVGFGDILWPPAPELTYPVTLGEAAPILHAYRPETVKAFARRARLPLLPNRRLTWDFVLRSSPYLCYRRWRPLH